MYTLSTTGQYQPQQQLPYQQSINNNNNNDSNNNKPINNIAPSALINVKNPLLS